MLPIALAVAVAALCSCRLQPKGVTAFKLPGKEDYYRAELVPPTSEERRPIVKLRFVDTNLFQTTATLSPGNYSIVGFHGSGFRRLFHVRIDRGTDYYNVAASELTESARASGPKVSGGIYLPEQGAAMPAEVVVLFIGQDFVVRRAPVAGGRFEAEAPDKGTYRVEVHALGSKVRSWTAESIEIGAAKDLGLITMR